MTAHRYWKLNVTGANNGVSLDLAELQFRATVGGPNLATGGTASASSTAGAGFEASKAFDNDTATLWRTASFAANACWLAYDFGAGTTVDITEIAITAGASTGGNAPRDFGVQWSDDGSTWTTLWSVSGQISWGNGSTRTYPRDGHVYWRVSITANGGNTEITSLAEVQFRATAGGADQATGGTASAASNSGGYPATNAYDDNTATEWRSAFGSVAPTWVGYQFATPVVVAQVALSVNHATVNRAPKTFDIQWSDNGTTWTTAASYANEPAWATQETRLYAVPAVAAGPTRRRALCIAS